MSHLPKDAEDFIAEHLNDVFMGSIAAETLTRDLIELLNHPASGEVLDLQTMAQETTIQRIPREVGLDYDLQVTTRVKIQPVAERIEQTVYRVSLLCGD